MVNPKKLCRQHLLGEHKELHQLIGSLRRGRSIQGHIDKGQVEVHSIGKRHRELVKEMRARGYKHESPLKPFKAGAFKAGRGGKVNVKENEKELKRRCRNCGFGRT